MNAQSLYDLSPAVEVMLAGLLLALGPLAWVGLRHRRGTPLRWLQALTVLTLFLTFDLVMFGAFTRLTDSGLGCPDWPGCYGNASPVGAHAEIHAAQQALPSGPVTHDKAWVEMVHRYLATGVGVLIIVLLVGNWALRRRGAPTVTRWAAFTLLWVCLQGAFGALTVTMKLFPAIVTMHLLGGLVLLALLCVQAVHHAQVDERRVPVSLPAGARTLLVAAFAVLVLQVALGGWVSTNYAVLACSDFPQCQSSWWPEMDFRQAFTLWRPLGLMPDGESLGFPALTAIHFVHRLGAVVALVLLALLARRLWRVPGLERPARWLAGLAALQLATGLSNVVLGWPLLAAVLHTGGAAALVTVLTWAVCESRAPASQATRSRLPAPELSA